MTKSGKKKKSSTEEKKHGSGKQLKKKDMSGKEQTTDSESERPSDTESILLDKEFKKRESDRKTKHKKKSAKEEKNESDSSSDNERISCADHQVSDSEMSTDTEIKKIAKDTSVQDMDVMSDFSVKSPVKKRLNKAAKTLEFGSSKKNVKDNLSVSDSESDMSPSIPNVDKLNSKKSKSTPSPQKDSPKKHSLRKRRSIAFENEVMEQNFKLRYKVPKGFEPTKIPVSETEMCKEDMDGKELWLIKAPMDFNIQLLDGLDINLNGDVELQSLRQAVTKHYEVTGTPDSTEMVSFSAVLPSREKCSYVVGPRFKGQIHVMQSLDIPALPLIRKVQPVSHEIPEGLKPRFKPFGADTPILIHKKKHHHHSDHKSDEDHSKAKKVKKEKKKKHEKN